MVRYVCDHCNREVRSRDARHRELPSGWASVRLCYENYDVCSRDCFRALARQAGLLGDDGRVSGAVAADIKTVDDNASWWLQTPQ